MTAPGTAQRPAASRAATWLIRLTFDDRDRVAASGARFAGHGAVEAFFDGHLYDLDDWRARAGVPADAEPAAVAAAWYGRHGVSGFDGWRGRFALVIIDRAGERALLVRDPLGARPLFLARTAAGTFVSSSLARLLDEPEVPRNLNPVALADHLSSRWPIRFETFYRAIERVPQGWVAAVTSRGIERSRYWRALGDRIEWLSGREVDRFSEVLDRAVRRGLSHGPSGIFLSGGFDSVSVAAIASDLARSAQASPPAALSLGFPDPACDERERQRAVAATLGLPLDLVDFDEAVGPAGLIESAFRVTGTLTAPLFNTWLPAYMALLERARARGLRTVLTGDGGDEWLGVSPFLAADLWKAGHLVRLARLTATLHRSFDLSWADACWRAGWTFGLRPLAGAALASINPAWWDRRRATRRVEGDPAWVAPDPGLRAEQVRRAPLVVTPARPAGGFYAREASQFLDETLQSWALEEQFEVGNRFGIEFCHPYWDADLLVQVYRTPPDVLNEGNRTKGLVRDMLARRFAGLGFERQRKVSALSFFARVAAREGPAAAAGVRDFQALAGLGVVDPVGAGAFVERAFTGTPRERALAVSLVNVERWIRSRGGVA